MALGLVEEAVKWQRRGTEEPWLRDSFMAELSPEAIGRLERHASLLLAQDQTDWTAVNAPMVIVLAGTIRVYRVRVDGQLSIDRITGIGDLVNGETMFTDPVPMRLGRTPEAKAMAVPRGKFRDLIDRDDEIRHALMGSLAFWLRESTLHQSQASQRIERRLLTFLVRLGQRHGRPHGSDIIVDVGLSQADLAAAIGASHNSVEAALRRLRGAGKLSTFYSACVLHALPTGEEMG